MAESDRRYTRAIVLHQHGVHENACRIAAWSSRCLPESHPSSIGAETIMRSSSSKTHTFPLRRRSRRSRIRLTLGESGRRAGAEAVFQSPAISGRTGSFVASLGRRRIATGPPRPERPIASSTTSPALIGSFAAIGGKWLGLGAVPYRRFPDWGDCGGCGVLYPSTSRAL